MNVAAMWTCTLVPWVLWHLQPVLNQIFCMHYLQIIQGRMAVILLCIILPLLQGSFGSSCMGLGGAIRHNSNLSRQRVPKSAAINDTIMPNTTDLKYGSYGLRAVTGRRVAAATIEAVRRLVQGFCFIFLPTLLCGRVMSTFIWRFQVEKHHPAPTSQLA